MNIKQLIKKCIPASHAYVQDQTKKILEQEKQIKALQQETIALLKKAELNTRKDIRGAKDNIIEEMLRRDEWLKKPGQIRLEAGDRKVWVIKCCAPDTEAKIHWGDFGYANSLAKYLERLGCYVVVDMHEDWNCELEADVVLVLRGKFAYVPDRRNEKCVYIMWNISHPDLVTPEEYNLYDVVCIGSKLYADKIRDKVKTPVVAMQQCTDTEIFCPPEKEDRQDYIFIGNSRGIARSCVMWAVESGVPLRMWGGGWNKFLQDHQNLIVDTFVLNEDIPDIYRSAKVTLNDHWPDMLEKEYVNNRIFDALACGLPVISDGNEELHSIFPDAVLYYHDRASFEDCIQQIENHYDEVKARVDQQWQLIKDEYSFERRAQQLMELADQARKESKA